MYIIVNTSTETGKKDYRDEAGFMTKNRENAKKFKTKAEAQREAKAIWERAGQYYKLRYTISVEEA